MRTVIIGDIHGQYRKFCELLAKVRFDPSCDCLIINCIDTSGKIHSELTAMVVDDEMFSLVHSGN